MSQFHTDECDAAYQKFQIEVAEYCTQWPNHCINCGGSGMHYFLGNYHQPPDQDPCGACWERGKCPRCGMENAFKTEDCEPPCQFCGWNQISPVKPEFECPGCRE